MAKKKPAKKKAVSKKVARKQTASKPASSVAVAMPSDIGALHCGRNGYGIGCVSVSRVVLLMAWRSGKIG
jgi:hypothetical protein